MAVPRTQATYIVKRIAPQKLGLLCLAAILLSCNAPEADLSPPAAGETAFTSKFRCDPRGRCSWQLVPNSNTRLIVVKSDLVDLVSSLFSCALVVLGSNTNMPYYYLPWLVLSLKCFLVYETPAIWYLGRNVILSGSFPATCLYTIYLFVAIQQVSVWYNVLQIFCRVWEYYIRNSPHERLSSIGDD